MRPLQDNIVVVQDGLPSRTKSGIYINILGQNRQARPNTGVVESIGKLVKNVKVGDRILFTNYSGVYFKTLDQEDRIIMSERDPLMIIKDKDLDINSHFNHEQIYNTMGGIGV